MSRTPEHEREAIAAHARAEALKDAPIIQAAELRDKLARAEDNYATLTGQYMDVVAKMTRARDLCRAIVTLEAGEIGNYSEGKYETAARILRALDGEQP